ncbi:MAG: hypothetical protein QOE92_2599 [Chloroflexota bacterium]|jgi:hypothetical protein|nr:hypothetical protein [Chloroflexota bacterium]
MTRRVPVLLACLALAGCSIGTPTSPASSGPCKPLPNATVAADGPPAAIMRDLSGGPSEYLLGVPGGSVARIEEATGFSAARLGGGRVFFSVRRGATDQDIRAGKLGECAVTVGAGTMAEVDPQGRAVVVGANGKWKLVDNTGKTVTDLVAPGGAWTGDGRLVEPVPNGAALAVYDLSGARHDVPLPKGTVPQGTLGPHQELVASAAGIQALDLDSGAIGPLGQKLQSQRTLSGSPDGAWISFIDQDGTPQLLNLGDGSTVALPNFSPTVGTTWSRDSKWVAVQGLYGGVAFRVADRKVIDMGSLIVVSW